ncbi:MAG: hypothetical protein ACYDIA_04105 [Candidatus Humimicrobiaceae bacterium]
MMFMSFLYKEFWEIKTFSFSKVAGLCRADAKFNNINNMFDASIIPEKTMIDQYLSIHSWHVNKKDKVKGFVDTRDNCAHASGFIQYQQPDADRYFQDVIEYAHKISDANKPNILSMFFTLLKCFLTTPEEFNAKSTGEFIFDKIREMKLSFVESVYILKEPMPSYITSDESGILKVAYYFAMLQLHSEYLEHISVVSLPNELGLADTYFVDELYLLIETLDNEKRGTLQVQLEDELDYLTVHACSIDLSKLAEIISSSQSAL